WQQVLSTEPRQKCLTGNRVSTAVYSELGGGQARAISSGAMAVTINSDDEYELLRSAPRMSIASRTCAGASGPGSSPACTVRCQAAIPGGSVHHRESEQVCPVGAPITVRAAGLAARAPRK